MEQDNESTPATATGTNGLDCGAESTTGISTLSTLETIIVQLITAPTGIDKLELENLQEKLQVYPDLRLQTVKMLTQLLKKGLDGLMSTKETAGDADVDEEQYMKNVLLVIEAIVNSKIGVETAGEVSDNDKLDQQQCQEFKKHFSEVWTQVMNWKTKPLSIHKRIVTLLPEKIMPNLTKPLHMSDYLLSAFDLGGPLSILALHGIFTLMLRHNFEIPDFYTRLYSLFQPAIFQPKYRQRLFTISSVFLSSTHLPEALVGAFVKRLARLALLAPSPALPLVFDFITNLMIQHPGLRTLVDADHAPEEDPYLEDESDPLQCKAMESCLWEIKSLQHHVLPSIAKRARFIDKQLPKLEKDLSEVIGYGYEELFRKEMKRKRKKSDTLDLEKECKNLSNDTSGPNVKCSRLKGRPCILESEITKVLLFN